jgi:hypothetical protein
LPALLLLLRQGQRSHAALRDDAAGLPAYVCALQLSKDLLSASPPQLDEAVAALNRAAALTAGDAGLTAQIAHAPRHPTVRAD